MNLNNPVKSMPSTVGDRSSRPSPGKHFWGITLLSGLVVAMVGVFHGRPMVEKLLTELTSPVALVWMILFWLTYYCFLMRHTWPAWMGLASWLLLTIAGNSLFANWLIATLERPYLDISPLQIEKLDTVIVLGGGTSYRSGLSQFSDGGDRVGLAARLYHAGLTDQIICTGSSMFRTSNAEPHVRQQAAELLEDIGVPAERILLIPGVNTRDEMANLKDHFQAIANPPQRIGLITSAYHLRRAMRLAKQNGLSPIPIPADVKSGPYRLSPNLVVPGAAGLEKTKLAIKEYSAGWVGR